MRRKKIMGIFALIMSVTMFSFAGCGNKSSVNSSSIDVKNESINAGKEVKKLSVKKGKQQEKTEQSEKWSKEEIKYYEQVYKDYNSSLLYSFMNQSWGNNPKQGMVACSNINMYLASGMLSEMTTGKSREQILNSFGDNLQRVYVSDCENIKGQEKIERKEEQKLIRKSMGYISSGIKTKNCSLGNSIWLNNRYDFSDKVLEILKHNYNAYNLTGKMGSRNFDDKINTWIDKQTGGKVKGNIKTDKDMVMMLLSTVNFEDQWKVRFDKNNTKTGTFYGQNAYTCGNTTEEEKIDIEKCEFLNGESNYAYTETDKYQAVSIPMSKSKMNIILPKENIAADRLINKKTAKEIISLCDENNKKWDYSKMVRLSLPKLEFDSELDMNPILQSMGVKNIFNRKKADFSELMSKPDNIYVSQAKQKSSVNIDENGCSMASYTEITLESMGLTEKKVTMNCNRPFVLIVSTDDGLPVFMGAVNRVTGE